MNKIFLLFDCRLDNNDKQWLADGLEIDDFVVESVGTSVKLTDIVHKGVCGRLRNYLIQIKQCCQTIHKSDNNDIIIVWYSVTGQIMNLLSRCCGGRNLVLMNFLTPSKRPWPLGWLLKNTVNNPNNSILVNSPESMAQYRNLFHLKDNRGSRFHFFPDVYNNTDDFVKPRTKCNRYFFTGGMTNRDWNLVFEIAKSLPDERFVCCALSEDFEKQERERPQNVELHFNLPSNEYYRLMEDSYCVLLPLKNNAVAGLINILKALQLGVPCCVSETTATKQYFHSNNRDFLLPKKLEAWTDQIKHIVGMSDSEYIRTVQGMQRFIQDNFSPESGIMRLQVIINQINKNKYFCK